MRRRMHLIPFTVTVPLEKRDPHLTEKLLRERDGILAWAVQGCLLRQKEGLHRPRTVDAATTAYFESEVAIGTWIAERCKRGADERALTATLYNDWLQWAQASGEFPGTQRRFSSALLARGGVKWRNATGVRGYRGIGLKQPTSTPHESWEVIGAGPALQTEIHGFWDCSPQ
jgi:putative DNA primase/helicase